MDKLKEYRRKRDFRKTLEPVGADKAVAEGCLYVMHKHAASHDHFDLRLEQNGVLRSWALPKGPSLKPGEKRLAVEVEDHPLEYGGFEGVIPQKQYGGGTVMLWDAGRWHPIGKNSDDQLDFVLEGTQLHGTWTLVRTGKGKSSRGKSGKQWLLIKRSDPLPHELQPRDVSIVSGRTMDEIARDQDNQWLQRKQTQVIGLPALQNVKGVRKSRMPAALTPQLASPGNAVPQGDKWLHELKYDGYRLLAYIDGDNVHLYTRNGHDWRTRFSALVRHLRRLSFTSAILDGELVSLAPDGSSSFGRLQNAISSKNTAGLQFFCFDLLYLDGYDLRQVPLLQRKLLLEQTLRAAAYVDSDPVRYCDHLQGHGDEFHQQVCQLSLEGIVSKRVDAPYHSGRSKYWCKTKCVLHEEFVVGGFTPPNGQRSGFGSLLLGAYDQEGLRYSGRVGSGFSAGQLRSLKKHLDALAQKQKPFVDKVPDAKDATWVKPQLVIEVEFSERTRDGRLRHPVYRGVREDRDADEIRFNHDKQFEGDAAPAGKTRALKSAKTVLAGCSISHPDRILFPDSGISKLALAEYYLAVAPWLLPQLMERPLALLRCQESIDDACFMQKHMGNVASRTLPQVEIKGSSGATKHYSYIQNVDHLLELVQLGVVEFHPWGCKVDAIELPDIMIFDLDPSPGVSWKTVMETARALRTLLASLGLTAFLRTTGGKGLHLVIPLEPAADWDLVKRFSKAVAERLAAQQPQRLTTVMSKNKRQRRIFIDYLRNGRGSTAVASYSVRARAGAPVAVPIRWEELNAALRGDRYNVRNLQRRLSALKDDPWQGFDDARRPIQAELLDRLQHTGGAL